MCPSLQTMSGTKPLRIIVQKRSLEAQGSESTRSWKSRSSPQADLSKRLTSSSARIAHHPPAAKWPLKASKAIPCLSEGCMKWTCLGPEDVKTTTYDSAASLRAPTDVRKGYGAGPHDESGLCQGRLQSSALSSRISKGPTSSSTSTQSVRIFQFMCSFGSCCAPCAVPTGPLLLN